VAKAKASSNLEVLPTSPSLAQTLPSDAVLDGENDPARRTAERSSDDYHPAD